MRRSSLALLLCLIALARPPLGASRGQAPPTVKADADAVRLNNLGVASMNQQKFEVALKYFQDALARDQSFSLARVNQAVALLALQRYEPAQQLLEASVKADDRNARAWYNLGLLQKGLGNADASLAAFNRAVELAPDDAHARYFAGLIASQQQQYDLAIVSFTKALEIDPFLVSAEFGLARAYQRSGKPDDAKAHMDRFMRLTQEKVASAMSLAYGDQGPLSLAVSALLPPSATPAIRVTFAAADVGLPPATAGGTPATSGPGGCVIDADGDGRFDYVALNPRATGRAASLYLNRGSRFEPSDRSGLDAPGPGVSCTVGDFDNDELPDLAVSTTNAVLLFKNQGKGVFAPGPALDVKGGAPAGLLFVDFDHDTDLDLLVLRNGAPNLMLRNNGNLTFTDVTADRALGGSGQDVAATASDVNNDRAIDLVTTGAKGSAIYLNPREGHFRTLDAWTPSAPANTVGVAVVDFDKDGWMDLAFTHAGVPGVSLWRNVNGKRFENVPLPAISLARGFGITAIDYDNDGWIDLAAVGTTASGAGALVVLRNVQGTFEDATPALGIGKLSLTDPRGLIADDVDGDGDADLIVTEAGGAAVVARNDGGNANRSLRLTLKGLNDNRSGVGTKVEVQAGALWQKFETVAASGYFGSTAPGLIIGLGDRTEADVVRLLWPTGVVQDEVQLAAATPHEIQQIDRRGSSCPILFSWNGTRFEFISDTIGPAVVGHWVAPGEYDTPDTDEFVKVDGSKVKVRDGRLSFHFTEPMEEINYLDQVKLFVVDHPNGTEANPNEYFAAEPPFPADKTFVSRGARLPLGAWDDKGRDVMPMLRANDRRFVDTFDAAPFKGFAKMHALELDLGSLTPGTPLRLLMRGFTDYFTATSMYAADQANVKVVVPYLEAQLADGSWRRVSDDIGFPAGLMRTMTADLTGKLPAGTRRIRIWTNLKIYWDQVLVDTTPDGAIAFTRTEIPLLAATLSHRGYPREILGRTAGDLRYAFNEVSTFGPYERHRGYYTKYGDVTPLLAKAEDHFVIFGSGDDVAIDFDATKLPALRAGWTRDYEVYLDGYVKDMDFWGAFAQTVAPLPFKAMPSYPYPPTIAYPDANREYQLEWNTREVGDDSPASYRFQYKAVK